MQRSMWKIAGIASAERVKAIDEAACVCCVYCTADARVEIKPRECCLISIGPKANKSRKCCK